MNFLSHAGVAGNGSAWGFSPAPDGDQVAFLQSSSDGTGSISQSVAGLTAGSSYVISFQAAQRPGYGVNPITVKVNGTALGTFSPGSAGFAQFTTAVFQPNGSSATVEFIGAASGADTATGVDKVTVMLAPL
jgi:hypothetical protein